MENFYTDNPHLKFHLTHPLMAKIVKLKEADYTQKDKFDFAPLDYEDAIDSYDKIMEIIGGISGGIVAPNAESVDKEGPQLVNNEVNYARGTQQNYDAFVKAGLVGLTRTLALEWAPSGIRVNALCPAEIQETSYETINPHNPQGRAGKPEEVAAAALFLCSDAASFITGQALNVDGGLAMG